MLGLNISTFKWKIIVVHKIIFNALSGCRPKMKKKNIHICQNISALNSQLWVNKPKNKQRKIDQIKNDKYICTVTMLN